MKPQLRITITHQSVMAMNMPQLITPMRSQVQLQNNQLKKMRMKIYLQIQVPIKIQMNYYIQQSQLTLETIKILIPKKTKSLIKPVQIHINNLLIHMFHMMNLQKKSLQRNPIINLQLSLHMNHLKSLVMNHMLNLLKNHTIQLKSQLKSHHMNPQLNQHMSQLNQNTSQHTNQLNQPMSQHTSQRSNKMNKLSQLKSHTIQLRNLHIQKKSHLTQLVMKHQQKKILTISILLLKKKNPSKDHLMKHLKSH